MRGSRVLLLSSAEAGTNKSPLKFFNILKGSIFSREAALFSDMFRRENHPFPNIHPTSTAMMLHGSTEFGIKALVMMSSTQGSAMVGKLTPHRKPLVIFVCMVVKATQANATGSKPSVWLLPPCKRSRKLYKTPVVVDSRKKTNRNRTVPTPFSKLPLKSNRLVAFKTICSSV